MPYEFPENVVVETYFYSDPKRPHIIYLANSKTQSAYAKYNAKRDEFIVLKPRTNFLINRYDNLIDFLNEKYKKFEVKENE